MLMRAAVYARFSTDLQNEKSVEDQIALCRQYAAKEGLQVVAEFYDQARSGASIMGREGLIDLLAQAKAGKFDVVIVEALDRLSRDMEDLAGIHKRFQFQGIEIRAVHEGVANTVLVGLRGLVGQLYREDNVHKVRRGMTGLVKAGLSAGGRAYGYRPDPANKGKLLINDDEAEIIRRVFREYAEGKSPRAICYDLNNERIPAPRGTRWSASTIHGSLDRGYGILHNQLYVGKIVWNKVRMVKDPDTGKRLSRSNPPSEWKTADVPELRIVDQALWDEVHAVDRKSKDTRPEASRRPKRLLSGLLKCGACGAGMSTYGKDKSGRPRIRCSAQAQSGTCPDPRTYYLETVEKTVLDMLLKEMEHPDLLVGYVEAYIAERRRLAHEAVAKRSLLERKLSALEAESRRLVDLLAKGIAPEDEAGPRLYEIRDEKAAIKEQLDQQPEPAKVVELHPQALRHYGQQLRDLQKAVQDGVGDGYSGAAHALRDLVLSVTVHPDPEVIGQVKPIIRGKLNDLLGLPTPGLRVGGTLVAEDRLGRKAHPDRVGGTLVAGDRFGRYAHQPELVIFELGRAA